MRRLWGKSGLARDESGGIAIIGAVFGLLLCGLAALAVDLGSVALTARRVQGAADLAALSAARDLDRAEQAARATAQANLPGLTQTMVAKGRYLADSKLKPEQRFTVQGADVNAARVEVSAPAPLYFGRWLLRKDEVVITRQATAALPGGHARAMFFIGSRLASLDGGIANAILSGLLGSSVSLKVADYNALVDTRINLLQFSDALAADIGLTAGNYDALLRHEVTTGQVLKALEMVASSDGRSVLSQLTSLPLHAKLKLSDLIGVEADARQGLKRGLDADVSALSMLMATLQTVNGERQLALDLGARAGLANLDIILGLGERPNQSAWLTVTSDQNPIIRTGQARLYINATTAQALSGLAQVKLPILVEVAPSEARLNSIQCRPSITATLDVFPGVAHAKIGEVLNPGKIKDFKTEIKTREATILSALGGIVRITASADLRIAGDNWQTRTFTLADVKTGNPKSVQSKGLVNGLIVSLLQRLDAKVVVVGLPLVPIGDLLGALTPLLSPLGPVLDGLIDPLLELLGLKLGEADVWVHAIECPQNGHAPLLVG